MSKPGPWAAHPGQFRLSLLEPVCNPGTAGGLSAGQPLDQAVHHLRGLAQWWQPHREDREFAESVHAQELVDVVEQRPARARAAQPFRHVRGFLVAVGGGQLRGCAHRRGELFQRSVGLGGDAGDRRHQGIAQRGGALDTHDCAEQALGQLCGDHASG
ncbi:hypothetical protein [Pseudonocardia ammonioxydans]|uniref:hypothetical protein n=1 Tax=Pseudonocardia ammonioxydans TaxID=260086 RepID=UPI0011604961|nr:hypothetical protein [Pseudonocardia ammonioxydans]